MTDEIFKNLTRRERQIMEVVYMLGKATASQILARMPDKISDGSLRKLVRVLQEKGHLTHERLGREHLYRPVVTREQAQQQAAGNLLRTLFRGSLSDAVSALLDAKQGKLDETDADQIRRLIDDAEQEGR